jgi:alcohol dehydrogenase class IV
MEAGLAFSNAILGAVHAMAHAVGGLYDSPHGECNSILLPEVVRANFPSAAQKYREAAQAIGIAALSGDDSDADRIAAGLMSFMAAFHVPRRLSQYSVTRADLPGLVDLALADPCMLTNPRQLTSAEVLDIYERCL